VLRLRPIARIQWSARVQGRLALPLLSLPRKPHLWRTLPATRQSLSVGASNTQSSQTQPRKNPPSQTRSRRKRVRCAVHNKRYAAVMASKPCNSLNAITSSSPAGRCVPSARQPGYKRCVYLGKRNGRMRKLRRSSALGLVRHCWRECEPLAAELLPPFVATRSVWPLTLVEPLFWSPNEIEHLRMVNLRVVC
jgi:hypothetical protein